MTPLQINMGSIYLAHTVGDANWEAAARRQGWKTFFEICQTTWVLIHRCGSPVIVRSLPGNDLKAPRYATTAVEAQVW